MIQFMKRNKYTAGYFFIKSNPTFVNSIQYRVIYGGLGALGFIYTTVGLLGSIHMHNPDQYKFKTPDQSRGK